MQASQNHGKKGIWVLGTEQKQQRYLMMETRQSAKHWILIPSSHGWVPKRTLLQQKENWKPELQCMRMICNWPSIFRPHLICTFWKRMSSWTVVFALKLPRICFSTLWMIPILTVACGQYCIMTVLECSTLLMCLWL